MYKIKVIKSTGLFLAKIALSVVNRVILWWRNDIWYFYGVKCLHNIHYEALILYR
jgi:hypothetical protein